MMKQIFLLAPLAFAAFVFAGCQNSSLPSSADNVYSLKGKVTAVNATAKEVTIDHEDVPGLMKAMQMTFSVEDARLLDGVKPGSDVEGQVRNASGKYVLIALKERSSPDASQQKKIQAALTQLPAADRSLAEKQRLCPSSNEPLGLMGAPVKLSIKGETVFICCKACMEEVEKHPDEMLKKVASFKEAGK